MGIRADTHSEYAAQLAYLRLALLGTFSLSKTLLLNFGDLRRLRQLRSTDEHYVRPSRAYDLPLYSPGMQYYRSREKYLRPTRYCDPSAPEVVALAHSLGAHRVTDAQFAAAAFHFVKEKLHLEIRPIDSVSATLERGTGTCYQLISVFIALCRAAGIRARYKIFAMGMIQAWREETIDADPLAQRWYNSMGHFLLEGEGEAYVDGRWQAAHVGPTAERQAAAGLPITHLGEDAIGLWFRAPSGAIMRFEALPMGLAPASRLLYRIAPGSMQRVSLGAQKQHQRGGAILAQSGGAAAYDAKVRAACGPEVPLLPRQEIVFKEEAR
jgi:hypothetical protein